MVPSIIDVWGYDREFVKKHTIVMKFCNNVDIYHPKRLVIPQNVYCTPCHKCSKGDKLKCV